MGERLKDPQYHESPYRKADLEYPFYDKNSLNKDLERFVKEATPRKIFKDSNSAAHRKQEIGK